MMPARDVPPLIACRRITKRYGNTTALEGVDFEVRPGEIHGLVGTNGAGKSTLVKILAGAIGDYSGQMLLDGEPVRFASPQAALRHGVAMVYQELSNVGCLSVAENLFLGRQPTTRLGRIDWSAIRRQARQRLEELGIPLDVDARLDTLPLGMQQMVEIARGLYSGARVLILDEPTSALSPHETERLFALVRELKTRGVGIVFISHFIEDVLAICDVVTILRDARRIETTPAAQLDKHYVIHTMLGHSLEGTEVGYESGVRLPPRREGAARLEVRGLSLPGAFEAIDLDVQPGECLGLYGFTGAGHERLVHALAGAARPRSGPIRLEGRPLPLGQPPEAIRRGVVLVAADRTRTLVRPAPVYQNVTLAHLRRVAGRWLVRRREAAAVAPMLGRVGCRPPDPRRPVGTLSGGNQQKVVVARWLLGEIRVLLLDEPTRGMDVRAKEEVMQLVRQQQADGAAVVLASTEPEMVLAHADRILVMHRGRITREFADETVDKSDLMRHA